MWGEFKFHFTFNTSLIIHHIVLNHSFSRTAGIAPLLVFKLTDHCRPERVLTVYMIQPSSIGQCQQLQLPVISLLHNISLNYCSWFMSRVQRSTAPISPSLSQNALNQISQRSALVFLRYIWVILLTSFLYINYMNDYFVRSSNTPTEHKSGSNTTAYHNSLVQTQPIFAHYASIALEGSSEIWCWNWKVFEELAP